MGYLNAFWNVAGVQDYILGVIGLIFVCEIVAILIDRFLE